MDADSIKAMRRAQWALHWALPRVHFELPPYGGVPLEMDAFQCTLDDAVLAARQLDATQSVFSGQPYPVRTSETVIELTYQLQLAPWWQLQPDFQYVVNPGGGVPNPNAPGQRIGNAAILGLRTTITF